MEPRHVTVIIPCYNAERFLAQAIESALAQSHAALSVLVVDDGSTDGSAQVAQAYESRVRLLRQPNSGVSAARNAGIAASESPFVAFLDADDVLLPDCIERRLSLLEARPDAGLVSGAFFRVTESLAPLPQSPLPTSGITTPGDAIRNMISYPLGMIARREVFRVCGGFDPLITHGEDWDLQIRVSLKFGVLFDPEPGALYRQLGSSASANLLALHDGSRMVLRKSAVYCAGPRFAFDRFVGTVNILGGAVFGKLARRPTDPQAWKAVLSIVLRRPSSLPYGVLWAMRATWNRTFGRLWRLLRRST